MGQSRNLVSKSLFCTSARLLPSIGVPLNWETFLLSQWSINILLWGPLGGSDSWFCLRWGSQGLGMEINFGIHAQWGVSWTQFPSSSAPPPAPVGGSILSPLPFSQSLQKKKNCFGLWKLCTTESRLLCVQLGDLLLVKKRIWKQHILQVFNHSWVQIPLKIW